MTRNSIYDVDLQGVRMNRSYLPALLFVFLIIGALGIANSAAGGGGASRITPELLTKAWSARWITLPNISPYDYGVYHFRRTFELQSKPTSFVIHVTGDNRYQLFVTCNAMFS